MTTPNLQETIEALEQLSDTPGGNYVYGELSESDKDVIDNAITLLKAQQGLEIERNQYRAWVSACHSYNPKYAAKLDQGYPLPAPPQAGDRDE